MAKRRSERKSANPTLHILLGLFGLGVCITFLLQGVDVALFNPSGFIAGEQHKLMLFSGAILLLVAIPTLALLYFFAWKYRESNQKATYDPHVRHGKLFAFSVWAIPSVFMLILASVMWPATHNLAPQKLIKSNIKPLKVQVVAMRWKWVFIYPEQNIATVNFLQIPVNTPVQFIISADEVPMSSFWIPHLGGQLYAMTGHANSLNLIANKAGDYRGSSAEINGAGFAGMKFMARASSTEDFERWVQNVKYSSEVLDSAEYAKLLTPSEDNVPAFYSSAEPDLYDKLFIKYSGSHNHISGYE